MLAAVALCACSAPPAHPAASSNPAIDAIAEAALRDGDAVGVSIVVAHGDHLAHAGGYGFADLARRVPATEHSVYPLASLSKQFWATAALQLAEHDRLDIEGALVGVLYNFPDKRVTVRDLMQQTSGLGDDRDDEDDLTFQDHPTLAFAPGAWWQYSNRGAILVRRVVEQITGTPWSAYLRDRIAKPLGLTSVTTCGDHVALYAHGKPSGLPTATMQRVQFVCADAVDVMRFERALDTGALLTPASVTKMRTPVRIAGSELGYGLSTRIAELERHRAYGHTGNFPGVSVAAFRFPADDLTIVVLMNATPRIGYRAVDLVEQIARLELRLAAPVPGPPPADLLADIAGEYDAKGQHGTIAIRDGQAWLTVGSFTGALAWLGGRRFHGGPEDADIVFLPASGRAQLAAIGTPFLLDVLARRVP